jgi:hypothetical protein
VLRSELGTAGHTDALEIPLPLMSDVVAADVELNQRPIVGGAILGMSVSYQEGI